MIQVFAEFPAAGNISPLAASDYDFWRMFFFEVEVSSGWKLRGCLFRSAIPRNVSPGFENHRSKGRQHNRDGCRPTVGGDLLGPNTATITEVTAPIILGIAVEDLLVVAKFGHPHAEIKSRYRCKVAADDEEIPWIFGPTDIAESTFLPIMAVDPFEAPTIEVNLAKGGLLPEETIQVGHTLLHPAMGFPA